MFRAWPHVWPSRMLMVIMQCCHVVCGIHKAALNRWTSLKRVARSKCMRFSHCRTKMNMHHKETFLEWMTFQYIVKQLTIGVGDLYLRISPKWGEFNRKCTKTTLGSYSVQYICNQKCLCVLVLIPGPFINTSIAN